MIRGFRLGLIVFTWGQGTAGGLGAIEKFREKPDYGDIRLSLNDTPIASAIDEGFKSPAQEGSARTRRLEEQRDRLAKHLQTDSISALTDKDMWRRMHKYISANMPAHLDNGYFSISLVVQHIPCVFVFACIPAEVVVPLPSAYRFLIPRKAYGVPALKELLVGVGRFLAFVKKKSKKTFMITFYVGRTDNFAEDLDFLLEIPSLIKNDPIKILRWLLKFEVKADGYSSKAS